MAYFIQNGLFQLCNLRLHQIHTEQQSIIRKAALRKASFLHCKNCMRTMGTWTKSTASASCLEAEWVSFGSLPFPTTRVMPSLPSAADQERAATPGSMLGHRLLSFLLLSLAALNSFLLIARIQSGVKMEQLAGKQFFSVITELYLDLVQCKNKMKLNKSRPKFGSLSITSYKKMVTAEWNQYIP